MVYWPEEPGCDDFGMMTSSNENIVQGIPRSTVSSPDKGQWRGTLMFSLLCAWINGWINNRGAGDLRRHRVHYNVIVMKGAYSSLLYEWLILALQGWWKPKPIYRQNVSLGKSGQTTVPTWSQNINLASRLDFAVCCRVCFQRVA